MGKSTLASQYANTVVDLEHKPTYQRVLGDLDYITRGEYPILVDEWQRVPPVWNRVKRELDSVNGQVDYILTGSSSYDMGGDGAGRFIFMRMHPMSLHERLMGEVSPTCSVRGMLAGEGVDKNIKCIINPNRYMEEVLKSGFPAIYLKGDKVRNKLLLSYCEQVIKIDLNEGGEEIRKGHAFYDILRNISMYVATPVRTSKINQDEDGQA